MKIGMYTDDEILEFMTEGEGRGFLGRSMFDAMCFEITRLNNIINEFEEFLNSLKGNGLVVDVYGGQATIVCVEDMLGKLKELKENK